MDSIGSILDAEKEAKRIVDDANTKAKNIIEEAERIKESIINDEKSRLEKELEDKIKELKNSYSNIDLFDEEMKKKFIDLEKRLDLLLKNKKEIIEELIKVILNE